MKRVYYISDVDISLPKGPSVNEFEFIDAMFGRDDLDVKVFLPKIAGDVREDVKSKICEVLPFSIKKKNLLHVAFFELAYLGFFIFNFKAIKESIVFTRVSVLPLGLFLIAPFLGKCIHVKTVGDGSFRYLRRAPFGGGLVWLHQMMYKWIARFVHSLDVVTESHKQDFGSNVGYGEKCFVVPNRVNTDVFFPISRLEARSKIGLASYKYMFGYVGNDPLNRGAKEAVDALYYLRSHFGLDVGLLVVGGVDDESIRRCINGRSTEHVYFVGQIDYKEVQLYMNALDVGVSFLPCWHRGASEQKVRQYLSCGVVPVVTPGGSDFVGKDSVGFVCEVSEIEKVADSILKALEFSSEMTRPCREYALKHLSHKKLADDRMRIFNL